MAGIGLSLKRLGASGGLLGPLKAFAYAAVIVAGPWLASTLAMALLGIWSAHLPGHADQRLFVALVSYAVACSTIGFGVLQMPLARVLADRLYRGQADDFAGLFVQSLGALWLVQGALAAAFLAGVPLSLPVRLIAWTLYLALNGVWLAMTFLSAAQAFRAIGLTFALGSALSLCAGYQGALQGGLAWELAGFTLGTLAILAGLVGAIDRIFGAPTRPVADFWHELASHRALAFAGLAFNLGVWVDKIAYWFAPATGQALCGWLHVSPAYDTGMSLASLATIPALALFLIKVETEFAERSRRYFATIVGRASLERVETARTRMAAQVWSNLGLLASAQGVTSFLLIAFTPEIMGALGAPWASYFVFRSGVLGSTFQVILLAILVHLLYFDLRRQAALAAGVFLAANGGFTALALAGRLPPLAYGYTLAAALALCLGLWLLDRALGDLEGLVFMRQPTT